jgi:hypothetical protein
MNFVCASGAGKKSYKNKELRKDKSVKTIRYSIYIDID